MVTTYPAGAPDSEVWNACVMVTRTPFTSMVPPILKPIPAGMLACGIPASIRRSAVPTMQPQVAPLLLQIATASPV